MPRRTGHRGHGPDQGSSQRFQRAAIAQETLEILKRGFYSAPDEVHTISVSDLVEQAVVGSFVLREADTIKVMMPRLARNDIAHTAIELTGETSLGALYRLASEQPSIAKSAMLLNFASAKNPGGGFLRGSQAQEESLARSSALYPCLQQFLGDMYSRNREHPHSCFYTHDMIYSPQVPFFRRDDFSLLDSPVLCSVISSPAVNAGETKGASAEQVVSVMRERLTRILQLAVAQGLDILLLGAWGCGVFRNDPRTIAMLFQEALESPEFSGAFNRVIFPIPDPDVLRIFDSVLGQSGQATQSRTSTKSVTTNTVCHLDSCDGREGVGSIEPWGQAASCGGSVHIELTSFGYSLGSGQPVADAVFSARHIANPKGGPKTHLSGLDARLRKEVMQCKGAKELLQEVFDDVMRRAEQCDIGGRISIAVGCERGTHRSVTVCEELACLLKRAQTSNGCRIRVQVRHREQEVSAGKTAQRRWQKQGSRGCRSVRESVVREHNTAEDDEFKDPVGTEAADSSD